MTLDRNMIRTHLSIVIYNDYLLLTRVGILMGDKLVSAHAFT